MRSSLEARFVRFRSQGWRQFGPLVACLCIAATGCSPAGTGTNLAGTVAAAPSTNAASAAPADQVSTAMPTTGETGASNVRLLALADGVQGGTGLWTFTGGVWTARWAVPDAKALGRDAETLTLATGGSLQSRTVSDPGTSGSAITPKWVEQPPGASIVSVDRSDEGSVAIVLSASGVLSYWIASADGTVRSLSPAPQSPFGPSVAWLDSNRLLAISADSQQIARLAVVDRSSRGATLIESVAGVRVFALSPDRSTLAAATESTVCVAPVGDWLASTRPPMAVALRPSQVVWDLALSADGSRMAMLSGTEDASGAVADIHELVYVHQGAIWAPTLDSPVPFSRAIGQVWID